jgi:Zn-finger nucleic acid-binding protein
MRAVQARARTGYLLVLDQCESCGGVWCDRWELFPLAASEAARLDPIDTQQLRSQNNAPAEPGRCPRCEIALRPFRDPMLPADARIERCRVCEGMWLNRGELSLAKRRAAALEKPHAAAVDGLARRYGEEARWTRVDDVGAAMFPAEDEAPEDAAIGASTWVAAAWIALRALLHLALRS